MVYRADSSLIKCDHLHDHYAGDKSTMSQVSRTGLKKDQLEKGLKEAEKQAAFWKKKALAYKQALEIVQSANPYQYKAD